MLPNTSTAKLDEAIPYFYEIVYVYVGYSLAEWLDTAAIKHDKGV